MRAKIGFQKAKIGFQGGKVPFRGGGGSKPPKNFALRVNFFLAPPNFAGGGQKGGPPSSNPVDASGLDTL